MSESFLPPGVALPPAPMEVDIDDDEDIVAVVRWYNQAVGEVVIMHQAITMYWIENVDFAAEQIHTVCC